MSECQGCTVPHETYTVPVRIPKSLSTRVAESWNRDKLLNMLGVAFAVVGVGGIMCVMLVNLPLSFCHKAPRMELQSFSIRDMVVYQNGTTAGWEVDSAFNVTLETKNLNAVKGCFTTIRRVLVRVEFEGQTIVDQEVPVGFGLRPREIRPVTMALQGQQFPLNNPDLGPYLQAEMERGNVTMAIYLYARYLRNDRRARWTRRGCVVVASMPTPSNSSSSLLSKHCRPI